MCVHIFWKSSEENGGAPSQKSFLSFNGGHCEMVSSNKKFCLSECDFTPLNEHWLLGDTALFPLLWCLPGCVLRGGGWFVGPLEVCFVQHPKLPAIRLHMECPHAGLTGAWLIHKRCASQRVGPVAAGSTLHKQWRRSLRTMSKTKPLWGTTAACFALPMTSGRRFVLDGTTRAVVANEVVPNWMTFWTTGTSILHVEASFISAERGLRQGISSRTSLKCHIHFGFILKLAIFICKQLKRPEAFSAVHLCEWELKILPKEWLLFIRNGEQHSHFSSKGAAMETSDGKRASIESPPPTAMANGNFDEDDGHNACSAASMLRRVPHVPESRWENGDDAIVALAWFTMPHNGRGHSVEPDQRWNTNNVCRTTLTKMKELDHVKQESFVMAVKRHPSWETDDLQCSITSKSKSCSKEKCWGELFPWTLLWKHTEINLFLLVITMLPVAHQSLTDFTRWCVCWLCPLGWLFHHWSTHQLWKTTDQNVQNHFENKMDNQPSNRKCNTCHWHDNWRTCSSRESQMDSTEHDLHFCIELFETTMIHNNMCCRSSNSTSCIQASPFFSLSVQTRNIQMTLTICWIQWSSMFEWTITTTSLPMSDASKNLPLCDDQANHLHRQDQQIQSKWVQFTVSAPEATKPVSMESFSWWSRFVSANFKFFARVPAKTKLDFWINCATTQKWMTTMDNCCSLCETDHWWQCKTTNCFGHDLQNHDPMAAFCHCAVHATDHQHATDCHQNWWINWCLANTRLQKMPPAKNLWQERLVARPLCDMLSNHWFGAQDVTQEKKLSMRRNMSRGDKNNHDESFTDCLKEVTWVQKWAENNLCVVATMLESVTIWPSATPLQVTNHLQSSSWSWFDTRNLLRCNICSWTLTFCAGSSIDMSNKARHSVDGDCHCTWQLCKFTVGFWSNVPPTSSNDVALSCQHLLTFCCCGVPSSTQAVQSHCSHSCSIVKAQSPLAAYANSQKCEFILSAKTPGSLPEPASTS